jgi:hypothetical protein
MFLCEVFEYLTWTDNNASFPDRISIATKEIEPPQTCAAFCINSRGKTPDMQKELTRYPLKTEAYIEARTKLSLSRGRKTALGRQK